MIRFLTAALFAVLVANAALAQSAVLQSGPVTPGHVPVYVNSGTSQPVLQDSGTAAGGNAGVGIGELGVTIRGTGTPPYANQGKGVYNANVCDYDAPTTSAAGYHYFCMSPNAQGGGLLAYGNSGAATRQPLNFFVNGTNYQFPFITGGILGPPSSTIDTTSCWGNTVGTLLEVCPLPPVHGPNTSVSGSVACWNNTIGTLLSECSDPLILDALTVNGAFTATGLVTNADLAHPATTVNGQTCTLGSTCTITSTNNNLTIGTTAVLGGTSGRVLYDNAGLVGNLPVDGQGNAVLTSASYAVFNVKGYGATGNGVTDDTAAIQAAINGAMNANGGTVYFPPSSACYLTSSTLLIDESTVPSTVQKRIWIQGGGTAPSCIQANGIAGPALWYKGNSSQETAYLKVDGLRIEGNSTGSSIGLEITTAAFFNVSNAVIEGFTTGVSVTDAEQGQWNSDEIRFNTNGMIFNTAICCTGPNSQLFTNTAVANNSATGITVDGGLLFNYYAGSLQYNGTTGGGSTQYGIKFNDTNYAAAVFSGVDFEGNGGIADVDIYSPTTPATVTITNSMFLRSNVFGPTYATNHILLEGAQADILSLHANYMTSNGGYTPNAGRPDIAITNTSAKVTDESSVYTDALEAPVWSGAESHGQPMVVNSNAIATNGSAKLIVHGATNENFFAGPGFNLSGASIGATDDALANLKPVELRTTLAELSGGGHLSARNASAVPTVSSCGTTPPAVTGSDTAGTITTGSSGTTACTLAFAASYASAPNCTATPVGAANSGLFITPSTGGIVFNYTSATSLKISYTCVGSPGG